MQLTQEQQQVLAATGDLVINAVAGSGKTSTLLAYAQTRPRGSRMLYLAFNKTVKTEAQQKFSEAGLRQVKVETAHSLAFEYVVKGSGYQVSQGYKGYELCELLGINSGDRHADYIIANHVNRFMSLFCNSNVQKVQELDYREVITEEKAKKFVHNFYEQIEQLTRELLAKMDKGEIAVTHDFYLKKFQLSKPVLPYDYILFDEGQDASGAMLDVFLQQKGVKVIVGDMHQQIYGWRFAVNSLQQVPYPVYNLSNSFRFDDEVALIANKILGWKSYLGLPPAVKINGAGSTGGPIQTRATIGRTNLALLLHAIALWQQGEVKSVYFEGNINSYTFADEGASLYDILSLYNGKKEKIRDRLIASMHSMKDLEDYIVKTEDTSMKMITDVVKEFGNQLPALISELKNCHTDNKEAADMIFSTVHRCKGMEYDEVVLLNDFITEDKLKKQLAMAGTTGEKDKIQNKLAEEINIVYVAVTRARYRLKIPPELNPLKSVLVTDSLQQPLQIRKSFKQLLPEETRPYQRLSSLKLQRGSENSNRKWTEEEEEVLLELFRNQYSLREIAKTMGRGVAGVRIRLVNLGMIQEGDDW